MNKEEAERISEESGKKIQKILRELESNMPGITEGFGAFTGAGIGGAASFAALSSLGTAGLSAAGITSGLAAAGALVGGGMVAGIGVLAAPVTILGIAGYSIFRHKKVKKQKAYLTDAITQLYDVRDKLLKNEEIFEKELAGIEIIIESLKERSPK